jgi:signal transduction histidine kinase
MPAADRARVGERFLRVADPAAPQEARGSGLGLAIAHAIAQRHGGRLRLEESHPGQAAPGLRVGVQWPA